MEKEAPVNDLENELSKTKQELAILKNSFDDFVHLAAHDLQSPVRKTATLLDRFNSKYRSLIPEEGLTYLDRIDKGLENMTVMINDLSKLAEIRVTSESHSLVSLEEVVKQVVNNILKQEPSVIFTIDALPRIMGEPEQIKNLFAELIGNALKFKKTDVPLEINIRSTRLSEEEKMIFGLDTSKIYANITVRDNGMGFNPEMSERVVKPFERLHGKSSYAGNGLGLAICKKIVESHLGKFLITGKENEGTTCTVILPEQLN